MQISRQSSNRIQIHVVSLFTRQMKPHRFENAHFWQRFQIDTVSETVSIGVVETEGVTASKTMQLQVKPRSCKRCLGLLFISAKQPISEFNSLIV